MFPFRTDPISRLSACDPAGRPISIADARLCRVSFGIGDDLRWENLGMDGFEGGRPFRSIVAAADYAVSNGAEWWRVDDLSGNELAKH